MSLLLDDVSIVVTPNGYKAGTLYGVLPTYTEGSEMLSQPVDLDADFIPNRVETVIDDADTFTTSGGNLEGIRINSFFAIGTRYKLIIEGDTTSSGFTIGNTSGSGNEYGSGFGTHIFTASVNTAIWIRQNTAGTTNITSFTVKEVTSSDMDVTRATAATRVDENGLVNYAEILGEEEVSDGDFLLTGTQAENTTGTYWTTGIGWTIANSKAECDGTQTTFSYLSQLGLGLSDKTYKIKFSVTRSSGTLRPQFVGGTSGVSASDITSSGDYTIYIQPVDNTTFRFRANSSFVGDVSDISVKEVDRDNVPRIDYTGGGCPHILAEPQRKNLIPYSEDFSSWTTTSATLTPNQLSPDGTNNAYIIEDDNATGSGYEKVDVTITTTATPCTLSVFIKKKTSAVSSYSGIQMSTGFSYLIFDSYNGTYNLNSSPNYDNVEVENFNSDWWRLKLTGTVTTSTRVALWGAISTNGTTLSPTATGSETFWGAQLEQGSYATSYIPNFGTAAGVTRAQDIFSRDGIGSLINSTEGVLFVEMAALADDETNREITLSDGSTTNYVLIRFNSGGSNRIYTRVDVDAGGGLQYFDLDTSHTITDVNKIAIRWGASNFATFINGVKVGSQLSGSSFSADTLNELNFDNGTGGSNFNGKVKQLQVYDTALTDEQLLQLTGESGTDFYESYAEMAAALTYTIQ